MISEETVLNLFNRSCEDFLKNEKKNIQNNVSERSLCGRLALLLESSLSACGIDGYYSDVEYNRKQNGEIKTIIDDHSQVVQVTCDIIVHSRGEIPQQDNLLALEMKKARSPRNEKEKDKVRLRALTKDSYNNNDVWSYDGKTWPEHVCGYTLGVYMEINSAANECSLEFYRKGERISESHVAF
jgi:hypothetical protein